MTPTLNPAEAQLTTYGPPAGQAPTSQTNITAAKSSFGLADIPNSIVGSLVPGLGALGGAIASPMPSLTANVEANPSVRFGNTYVPQLARDSMAGSDSYAGKVGSFVVSSGNSNAEARGQVGISSVPGWVWIAGAVAVVVALLVFFWKK